MASGPKALDRPALEALYARLETPVYNVVYRWLWNPDDASDVVQEAFVRLWKMRARVRVDTVEPLVFRIALNLASNRRRARRLWRWVSLEPEREPNEGAPRPDEPIEARQRRALVRAAIDALPERYRRVIVMCELSELSYAEVAAALDLPAGTVASRRHKAMELLRRHLGEVFDDEADDSRA